MKLQLVPKSVVRSTTPEKKAKPCSGKSCSFGTKARLPPPRCLLPFSSLLRCLLTTLPYAESLRSTCLQSHRSRLLSSQHIARHILSLISIEGTATSVLPRTLALLFVQVETATWGQFIVWPSECADRRILAATVTVFGQGEALLFPFCSEWL